MYLENSLEQLLGMPVGRDFAEAIMGHQFYLDTYYQLSDEKKSEMYLEAEPYLTISDFNSVEKKLSGITAKYSDLSSKVDGLFYYLKTHSIEIPDNLSEEIKCQS